MTQPNCSSKPFSESLWNRCCTVVLWCGQAFCPCYTSAWWPKERLKWQLGRCASSPYLSWQRAIEEQCLPAWQSSMTNISACCSWHTSQMNSAIGAVHTPVFPSETRKHFRWQIEKHSIVFFFFFAVSSAKFSFFSLYFLVWSTDSSLS